MNFLVSSILQIYIFFSQNKKQFFIYLYSIILMITYNIVLCAKMRFYVLVANRTIDKTRLSIGIRNGIGLCYLILG